MRILHVLEPTTAGVPRLLTYIVREQIAAGHEVCVLAPRPLDLPSQVRQWPWAIRRKRPWTYIKATWQVREAHRHAKPDVVHVHSFFAGLIARMPGSLPRATPLVYQPHAWAFHVFGGRVRWLVKAWERYAGRRTTALAINCEDELQRGRRAGITTAGWIVGIAVDIGSLQVPTEAERAESRAELGLGPGPVVLLLGRLVPQKGQDQLLRRWRPAECLAATRLVLVGPGDPKPLARLAGERWGSSVIHVGGTSDVQPWLWAADLMIIPSRYETVSLVAGEAMATGLPVVATDFDGAAEVLGADDDDPAGDIVPLGDMDAIVQATRLLLLDANRRAHYGASGRRRAVRYCSPKSVEQALHDAYAAITPAANVP
ncbi:MAG: glycosyltransferase family 4 protein [Ornithinimicrobium sp.]